MKQNRGTAFKCFSQKQTIYNQQLSKQRANTVKNALVVKNVQAARISALGMGESNPIADNTTEGGRQLNRRVNIIIEPTPQAGQAQPQG